MELWKPTEAELYDAGTLKWTGIRTDDGEPTLGAWVAEMDFGTSPAVEERLLKAVRQGFFGYSPRWAGPAVQSSLVELQDRRFGWAVKEGWVFVTPSILSSLRTTIEEFTRPGSAVIVPTPAYMPFLTIPGQHGREVVQVPSLHDRDAAATADAWRLDLEGIQAGLDAGAGLVILCNPWNPTGRNLSVEELRELNEVVSQYDALVFADEVHSPLVLGDPGCFNSYASLGPKFADHTITAVSASKAWNIAGLSCAQVILPDQELREKWEATQSQKFGSACALGQLAAVPAYLESDEWLAQAIAQINANLDLLDEALTATRADYHRPEATYLAWIGFDSVPGMDHPAEVLREKFHVGVNDGTALGPQYSRWIRVNAAMSPEPWRKVVGAIAQAAS